MIGNAVANNHVARPGVADRGDYQSSRHAFTGAPAGRAGWWLGLLSIVLLGYALFGKSWAYVGVRPVFVGEAVLLCGLPALLALHTWRGLVGFPCFWCLLLLGTWGMFRTWPDIPVYGVDALRDAALWGYALFALLVFGTILARPSRLVTLLGCYRWYSKFFLLCIPLIWITCKFFADTIPPCPWADIPLLTVKGGDVLIHLAGILAFFTAGLGNPLAIFWLLLLAVDVVLVGTFDRAGFLSFLLVFAVCICLRPRDRSLWLLTGLGVAVLLFLAITDIQIKMPEREREISFRQVVANVFSSFMDEKMGDLEDTKQWRLDWWNDILGYTVHGRYCWTGKGFGINLADDDGYQVTEDGSLRSPHNGHLTMLARGGVPGFMLWMLALLSWAPGIVAGYFRSRRLGQRRWNALHLFLFVFWLAFIVNGAFDVYLESPMGGIWFWSVYGVGMAAIWLYRHNPELLEDDGLLEASGRRLNAQPCWRS
jgi:O-Antigen ligase